MAVLPGVAGAGGGTGVGCGEVAIGCGGDCVAAEVVSIFCAAVGAGDEVGLFCHVTATAATAAMAITATPPHNSLRDEPRVTGSAP